MSGTLGVRVIGGAIGATLAMGAVVSIASAAAGSHGAIHGCVGKKGALRVVGSGHACKSHEHALSWAARGPAGPAGASPTSAVYSLNPSDAPSNTSDTRTFLGAPATVLIANTKTAAVVNATLDFSSAAGGQMDAYLEVCYQQGSNPIQLTSFVEPNFSGAVDDYWAQSVSGVVGNLPTGLYKVGVCSAAELNTVHGYGVGTVQVMQTTAGVVSASTAGLRRHVQNGSGRQP